MHLIIIIVIKRSSFLGCCQQLIGLLWWLMGRRWSSFP